MHQPETGEHHLPSRPSLAVVAHAAHMIIDLGGLGLLGVLLFVGQIGGRGTAERVADYPTIVWMVVLGISFVLWWRAERDRKQLAST